MFYKVLTWDATFLGLKPKTPILKRTFQPRQLNFKTNLVGLVRQKLNVCDLKPETNKTSSFKTRFLTYGIQFWVSLVQLWLF